MIEVMTHYDVIKKLIGPIEPLGESNGDRDKLTNLKTTIVVADRLIEDIINVSKSHTSYEASVRDAGKYAKKWCDNASGVNDLIEKNKEIELLKESLKGMIEISGKALRGETIREYDHAIVEAEQLTRE